MKKYDQFGVPLGERPCLSGLRPGDRLALEVPPRSDGDVQGCLGPVARAVLELDSVGLPLPGSRSSRPRAPLAEKRRGAPPAGKRPRGPPRKKEKPRAITHDEFVSVLAFSDAMSRCPLSDRVKLLMSYHAGMRPIEISGISKRTLYDANWEIMDKIIIHPGTSKRGRGREIPMHLEIKKAVQDLFEAYPLAQFAAFTNDQKGEIKYQDAYQVTAWFNKLYWEAGLRNVTGMSGRHAFAQRLEKSGVAIRDIQDLMGHANLRTTEFYFE